MKKEEDLSIDKASDTDLTVSKVRERAKAVKVGR